MKKVFYAGKVLCSLVFLISLSYSCSRTEPYKNHKLSVEKRVEDLISRMTVEEKISQLMDRADSIPRLGIPEYNWWNEGLHGVARAGRATVFPQAIGLAATFNDSLMLEVSTVISDEFRAKYNYFQSRNEKDRYKGLTVWSPNINIFRDPRWGRGQETYGEDPYLTSRMGVAFVKGLQGDHPTYFKTIATPKHYAVHSGPEPLRHEFDVDVSQRDFIDTYLPAFEATIVEGNAQSIMSAYNRFRGESASGSPYLLNDILRDKWGFEGYVVSDCGAIYDIFAYHKIASSEAEAAAIGLKSGCDLNCGSTYMHLKTALDSGYIQESDLDLALTRLFTARYQLGMFDPPELVPFNQISPKVNDSKAHRKLALEAALESMVLLKNENNTLPLSDKLEKIAVIGPNADDPEVMYGNYNGFPSYSITPLEGIRNVAGPGTEVLYSRGCNLHEDFAHKETIDWRNLSSDGIAGLKGEYFNNPNLEGTPFAVRMDSTMRLSWFNRPPMSGMSRENYSVRWQGKLTAPKSGKFLISVAGDDGFRFFLEDQLLIDTWEAGGDWQDESVWVELERGTEYAIELDFFQKKWGAMVHLTWGLPLENMKAEALKLAEDADAIVYVGGLSPELEGEEMHVDLSGFNGGDRVSIDLPESQVELIKELNELGKPLILVLMNGSALAVNWADEHVPAILEAWYPGQEGGQAIAEVLFGNYNPAGRLPLTFYKSVDQLPPFENYDMQGRTYRYFEGEALYKFGHGLSYTKFTYSNLNVPAKAKAGDKIKISVEITNSGEAHGDEVVQLYLRHQDAENPVPIHALKGIRRIHIEKGESRTVEFTLTSKDFAQINNKHQRVVIPGKIEIFLGGQQPDEKSISEGKVVMSQIEFTGDQFIIDELPLSFQ